MREKIILITGSTDGIGKATAELLASQDARILLHGRDQEKCEKVLSEIKEKTGNDKLEYFVADFSSLSEVRRMAKEITSKYHYLDVLINNAGIGSGKDNHKREISEDGFELRFAVNYLAPFLLTHLLLPVIQQTENARIVNVASGAQERIDFSNVMLKQDYEGMKAYSQSKLALVMFTLDLAQYLKDYKVTVNCLHPGSLLDTKMVREAFGKARGSAKSGAEVIAYLATSQEVQMITGKYFNKKEQSLAHQVAYDKQERRKLMRFSMEWTGLLEDVMR